MWPRFMRYACSDQWLSRNSRLKHTHTSSFPESFSCSPDWARFDTIIIHFCAESAAESLSGWCGRLCGLSNCPVEKKSAGGSSLDMLLPDVSVCCCVVRLFAAKARPVFAAAVGRAGGVFEVHGSDRSG